jgi:hypothetical protein
MRAARPVVAMAMALLALVGCAIPEVPYDRETAGGIRRIGVVTPRFPNKAAVYLATSVGKNFGLIGALIDAGMQQERENKFERLLGDQHFVAETEFVQILTAGLEARGYEVVALPIKRDQPDFVAIYPTHEAPVDAYLDLVTVGYGYVAAGIGANTPYRPAVGLKARLVRAKDQAVLMQDTIAYNPIGKPGQTVTIAPDPAHQYRDFDSLMADPPGAVVGLRFALEQSAQQVCLLLK